MIDSNDTDTDDADISIFKDCKYVDFDNLTTALNDCDGINVLQLNIRGLFSKLDCLRELLDELNNVRHKVDIIMLNETWVRPEQQPLCKLPGYQMLFKNRLNKRGGGVAIAFCEELSVNIIDLKDNFDEENICESLFVKVSHKKNKKFDCLCGTIYM